MKNNDIIIAITEEVKRARKKFPTWPDHVVARAAIVGEEAGELIRAALQFKYEQEPGAGEEWVRGKLFENMKKEAIQTAAMAFRFLQEIDSIQKCTKKGHAHNRLQGSLSDQL